MSNARYNMDTYKDLTAEQWHNAYQDLKRRNNNFCNIGDWDEGNWDDMEESIKAAEDEDIVKLITKLIGKLEK